MTKTNPIRLLKTFVRIVERGSISAAARDLNLSQASASRQLAQLEDHFGLTLIARSTHALALTEQGEQLLPEARDLIAKWDALQDLGSEDGPLTGSIKVIAPVALGQTLLMRALTDFQIAHPGISVNWILTDREIRFTEEGCDLWIRVGAPTDDRLISRPIVTVKRIIVGTSAINSVETPQDLLSHPCISLGPFEGSKIPLQSTRGDKIALSANPSLATNDIRVSQKAVEAGLGWAILPDWMVREAVKAKTLVNLLPDWTAPALPITLNYAPASRTIRRLILFRDAMEQALRSTLSDTA